MCYRYRIMVGLYGVLVHCPLPDWDLKKNPFICLKPEAHSWGYIVIITPVSGLFYYLRCADKKIWTMIYLEKPKIDCPSFLEALYFILIELRNQ